jgi:hypothetical protein
MTLTLAVRPTLMTVPCRGDDPLMPPAPPAGGTCGTRPAGEHDQPGAHQVPEDVPALRPPWLDELGVLAGEWETEAWLPYGPAAVVRGLTTFEWLAGQHYLIQRFWADHRQAPNGLAMIGASADGMFTQRYFDSRGVQRVYAMSLRDGVWRLWRDAPGFWQRYAGTLDPDGTTITGAWELSKDGVSWSHDFDLSYRRIA